MWGCREGDADRMAVKGGLHGRGNARRNGGNANFFSTRNRIFPCGIRGALRTCHPELRLTTVRSSLSGSVRLLGIVEDDKSRCKVGWKKPIGEENLGRLRSGASGVRSARGGRAVSASLFGMPGFGFKETAIENRETQSHAHRANGLPPDLKTMGGRGEAPEVALGRKEGEPGVSSRGFFWARFEAELQALRTLALSEHQVEELCHP